jgi:hypothetical protein
MNFVQSSLPMYIVKVLFQNANCKIKNKQRRTKQCHLKKTCCMSYNSNSGLTVSMHFEGLQITSTELLHHTVFNNNSRCKIIFVGGRLNGIEMTN